MRGRDTASFVAEATKALHEKVKFPDGYFFEFGGQFKNLVEAKQRLTIVVPLALALIFVLIFLSFGSLRQAALIFHLRAIGCHRRDLCPLCARNAVHHFGGGRLHRSERYRRAEWHHAHQLHQPTPHRRQDPCARPWSKAR